jgi:hypothetical protein
MPNFVKESTLVTQLRASDNSLQGLLHSLATSVSPVSQLCVNYLYFKKVLNEYELIMKEKLSSSCRHNADNTCFL